MALCRTSFPLLAPSSSAQQTDEARADINRLNATNSLSTVALSKPKPRIAIMSVTEDASAQYVPIMNCIFTAQKNVSTPLPLFARFVRSEAQRRLE